MFKKSLSGTIKRQRRKACGERVTQKSDLRGRRGSRRLITENDDDAVDEKMTSVASPLPHLNAQTVHASQVVYSHLIKIIVSVC